MSCVNTVCVSSVKAMCVSSVKTVYVPEKRQDCVKYKDMCDKYKDKTVCVCPV